MVNPHNVLANFLQLVQIDSISGRERKIADFLKEKITALGFFLCEDNAGEQVGGNAGNLIVTLPPAGKRNQPLLLCAHMDTVEPGQGVQPVVENGIIRSRGETVLGADDKSGIAAILEVLRIIKEEGLEHGGLQVVFTIWEEGGLLGAKHLELIQLDVKLGYVLDCDGPPGTIVVRAPSQDKITARVRGRAAHAGVNPEEGINAIQVAAQAITRMKLGRIDDQTTANIGIISGGRATNIVPDLVTLEGETRSLVRDKRQLQTEAMCNALKGAAREFGATVDISTETVYPDFWLPESSPVVQVAVGAAQKLGLTPRLVSTGGGSDANIFNYKGIPTVNLGIGIQKPHTTEEFIRVEDLVASTRYLLEIIRTAGEMDL